MHEDGIGGSSVNMSTLRLFPSEFVPPAPNRRESAVDWLPDFGGASWIAYGAGPLLAISHLSSPLSQTEPLPFLRQLIQLPEEVNAVFWCPSLPSQGEIAIAAGNSIHVYAPVSDHTKPGSFSWEKKESIAESFKIEAITWTGSGDALLAAGSEVVLFIRKKPNPWEVAWRATPQVAQTCISATRFAQGPVATASVSHVDNLSSSSSSKNVLVYLTDQNFGFRKLELAHPHGVSMIQWRPHLQKGPSDKMREILLTCSLDGTARLWSECGNNNINGKSKGKHDVKNKNKNKSFHVIAVIEINSCLNGSLGGDISLKWAVESESRGVVTKDETGSYALSESDADLDQVGKCEWLVSSGPHSSVSFWAVHCLDDLSPVRYPRVSLWRKQQQLDYNNNNNIRDLSKCEGWPILLKPLVSLKFHSGPPVTCSLVQFMPNNQVLNSILYSPESVDAKERYLSCTSFGVMNEDGHKGKIKQVCFDIYSCETELCVSLDSNGMIIFWSLSALSTSYFNLHMPSNPIWNLLGKIDLKSEYSCLTWAPPIHREKRFLILGSERQIDIFVVTIPSKRENFQFRNIFKIPNGDYNEQKGPPDKICTIPLDLNCDESILSNSFWVICVWKNNFQILSWKITINDKTQNNDEIISNDLYYVTVSPKVLFGNTQDHEKITCFAMYSRNNTMLPIKVSKSYNPSYHMITGCSDGMIKLWKMNNISDNWESVGSFIAHKGQIDSVSFSSCGTKIATCSSIEGQSQSQSGNSTIHIWEPVCLTGGAGGVFLLEQVISLKSAIIHLSWVSLGNGQLLLGVSLANEFRIYCQRRHEEGNLVNSQGSKSNHCFWDCIATSDSFYEIKGFLWGPKLTPVLVHYKHLSVFSQWLLKISNYENNFATFSNLIDLANKIGGPLPVYHPRALIQYLYSGKWKRVQVILQHLIQSINTSGTSIKMQLSDYFTENAPAKSSNNTGLQWGMSSQFNPNPFDYTGGIMGNNNLTTASQKSDHTDLNYDMLNKYSDISEMEKFQILAISDLLSEINDPTRSSPYKTLDEAGRKFWVSVQFERRYLAKKSLNGGRVSVNSDLIAWAFMSECKDDLLNSTLNPDPTWLDMHDLGLAFWYNDITQLRSKMEKLARKQYLKKRDPKECALLYIALNRIQVLAGLFKISKDEKDKPLFAFLSRNFQEEKNKGAALKNAYVLMGKHQLELAVAFFLLGGDVSSAITICAKNHGDVQLALVLCQLIQGSGGPLERDLISNVLLPNAIENKDTWLSSLLEWKLGNFSKSVQRLFENDEKLGGGVKKACFDPQVGEYCVLLASKNNFKNSVGENIAINMSKFCTSLTASALNRYGLHIEALECLSSKDQNFILNAKDGNEFYQLINPSNSDKACNWINGETANNIFSNFKLIVASKYLSEFLNDHLLYNSSYSDSQIGEVRCDFKTALSLLESKFFLNPRHLIKMISLFVCNKGLLFLKYLLFGSDKSSEDEPVQIPALIFKAGKEICSFITRYVISQGFIESSMDHLEITSYPNDDMSVKLYLASITTVLATLRLLLKNETNTIFDLIEYFTEFAFTWLNKDVRGLIILINPIVKPAHLEQSDLSTLIKEALNNKRMNKESEEMHGFVPNKHNMDSISMLSYEDKWIVISTCLWLHLSSFVKINYLENENLTEIDKQLGQLLINSLDCLTSAAIKQLAWFINLKLSKGSSSNVLMWLEKNCSMSSQISHNGEVDYSRLPVKGDEESLIILLWEICVRPKDICSGFVSEKVNCFSLYKKLSASWKYVNEDCSMLESKQKHDSEVKTCFHNPRELIKRSGELLEAVCINSVNQQQLAAASNKKGLVFFSNWASQTQNRHQPKKDSTTDYIWPESDWPVNGFAGSESTPIPTCVSPGVGLGTKRGAHLGLGGATIGFGIPGYGSISGLGWGESDPFEDPPLDPPPTMETVHSCALSTHPSLPLFLAGSSNTHVYLWEFGKDTALATYGVLAAANVPPPYQLASISAVQFEMCGHRFATAASDGTVCTWQLEVGGRSNVHPSDSSLCFNNHASDVAYVSASGAIVAVAGYSSNNMNVVVWDTLAPAATCQASLLCHEGGARSVAVFDKDVGNGSMSPLIITGGKNGDIGMHDFRFISTGKTKRNKGGDNSTSMIWYLPKAHLGSITRVASIPNTSMFLTGSKDGDVKLWDANKSEMVFHWPKLHDRHTFFQPPSRGFGGVVRAAVTDIQVLSNGFVTCGGDGSVKLIQLK